MTSNFHAINAERLWQTLEASGRIGKLGETGLRRLALSDEDGEMRDLFVAWARDAGCSVAVDEVGNIFVRRGGRDDSLAPVAMGSHLDTQIYGGRYDGILGVLSGLEVMRKLNEHGVETKRPLELVVWTNEEGGRFTPPMMGSSAFAGIYAVEDIHAARDADGLRFKDELERIGYAGKETVGARDFDAYFELHIEQGPIMDAAGVNVGIVTGSYTAHGMHVQITGETQHVGPTPMERRRNALVGAGYLIADVNDIGWKYYEDGDGKTTVTRIECHPNLFGIIPDSVRLTVDFRHPDGERVNDMFEEIREAMARAAEKARVSMEIVEKWTFGMVPFDADCIALLRDTARDMGLDYMEIPSQAGHDAYAIARVAPTCMIFTPCREGYTHNVKEEIELDKTVPGVNLLLNAVLRRANR